MCLRTKDAIEQHDDGRLVFNMPGDSPRLKAVKVSLGSLEFPMVQWTIEESWGRLYMMEHVNLSIDPANNVLDILFQNSSTRESRRVTASFPPLRNDVTSLNVDARGHCTIVFQHPHMLWCDSICVLPLMRRWCMNCAVVCSSIGRVCLSDAYKEDRVRMVDEHTVIVRLLQESLTTSNPTSHASSPCAGSLIIQRPPCVTALCMLLNNMVRVQLPAWVRMHFEYNSTANKVDAHVRSPLKQQVRVTVMRTPMSEQLGFGLDDRTIVVPFETNEPVSIATSHVNTWEPVSFRPGWYVPSSRPMCTGAPRNVCVEADLCMNRLWFDVPDKVPSGANTAYFMMFALPNGTVVNAPVPPGRYTAESFCQVVKAAMSEAAQVHDASLSVNVSYAQGRFTFAMVACYEETVRAVPFDLLFDHPLQLTPERIGFDGVVYYGGSSYTSPREALCRTTCSNRYQLAEITSERRFRLHACAPPALDAVISSYDTSTCILTLYTYCRGVPFVHGFSEGDTVVLSSGKDCEILMKESVDGVPSWQPQTVQGCALDTRSSGDAIVEQSTAASCLCLRIRNSPAFTECLGRVLRVFQTAAPFSICFHRDLPRSLYAYMLGFRDGATQWGVDGSLQTLSGVCLPPFVAPSVHNLDHPDYILVYLSDGKRSSTLQHTDGNNVTTPLTKIVLYPSFREERMIPRDTMFMSGESLTRFSLWFTNPDGTPYHFHFASFSFTLNFLKVQDAS